MSKKQAISDKFTCRDGEGTAVHLSVVLSDDTIEVNFTTPDYSGYFYLGVPWRLKQLEKYTNPYVFDEMIERLLPVEVLSAGFTSRAELEAAERHSRAEERRKAKREKGQ